MISVSCVSLLNVTGRSGCSNTMMIFQEILFHRCLKLISPELFSIFYGEKENVCLICTKHIQKIWFGIYNKTSVKHMADFNILTLVFIHKRYILYEVEYYLKRISLNFTTFWALIFFAFLFLKFLWKYSWFTMLCLFQVYSKVIQLYIYIHIYSVLDSFLGY